jgi:hypothetical protein
VTEHTDTDPPGRSSERLEPENAGPVGPVDFEREDVVPRAIVRFAVVLAVVTAVIAGLLLALLLGLERHEAALDTTAAPLGLRGPRQPVGPQLQVTPVQDLATFQEQERRFLQSYGWVDRQGGKVRVPINEGMRLFLRRYGTPGAEDGVPPTALAATLPGAAQVEPGGPSDAAPPRTPTRSPEGNGPGGRP